MKNKKFNRRNFLHKIVGLAAFGGLASLILGNKIEKAHALDIEGAPSAGQVTFWHDSDSITGSSNLRWDEANSNFIAGYGNTGGFDSAVCGGLYNTASNTASTIGGGALNYATGNHSTVSGGNGNNASATQSTVGGGGSNTASGDKSMVGGGENNTANNSHATVAGGLDNTASNECATVGGGNYNTATHVYSTVAGGNGNDATGSVSTVGGGTANIASGGHSTVPGGRYNTAAGDYSLAAGRRAKIGATHDGTFLFADSTEADFDSARAKEFAVRCTNGSRFIADSDNPAVKGENAGTGIGMRAESSLGTALHVGGRNYFESAQRGTIPTGVRDFEVSVSKKVMIADDAMIFVTLMDNPSNIGVRYVKKESDFTFRIHLTGKSRNDMPFGYFIVN